MVAPRDKDERDDDLYTAPEIEAFGGDCMAFTGTMDFSAGYRFNISTLKAVKTIVRKSYSYMINHADARSVAYAIELKHVLGEPVPDDQHPGCC